MKTPRRPIQRGAKRVLDASVSMVLLVLASPIIAGAALAIAIEDGRPIVFLQRRTGRLGREFDVVKLRSMRSHDRRPEELGQVRGDHELVTRTGRLARRLKIDELPQLINVVRGEMSLVGPRPTLPSQVREYDRFQARRLEVRPGLTGWAQVNGNAELSWEDRIRLDVWYVDHWSLGLDLRILRRTASVVLRGERIGTEALTAAREHENSARRDRRQHAGRA